MSVELAVLILTIAVIAVMVFYMLRTGIPPVPTSPRVRRAMFRQLPARLDGAVYELGAGWGTLAFPLARRYPDCPVIAYELSPVPWLFARLRQRVQPLANLTIRRADFHRARLGDAALVVCYLFPGGMAKLRPKLERELRPGALVVSNTFAVPGWRPVSAERADDLYASPVYVYRMPQPP